MSARGWALTTAGFGLATIALFAAFALLPEMRVAASCMPAGAVVQFELARNSQDLARIFGVGEASCGPRIIAALDAVNRLDLLAFIPTYTAFGIAAALYLSGGTLRPLALAAIIAAVLAAAGDYLETATLLQITQTLGAAEPLLPRSQAGAWSKFTLLAAHGVFCAGLCFLAVKRRTILGALLLLPAPAVALAAYDHLRFANVMNAAFALAWVGLLVSAIIASVRAKDVSVAPPPMPS